MNQIDPCHCTHLRVRPDRMVNISSMTIPNDNGQGHTFFYDRQPASEFSVPENRSFVVTDIIVHASSVNQPIPDPNRYIMAVVNFTNNGERIFHVSFSGDNTAHYPLSGGIVIPGGHTPHFRNTTWSTTHAQAQLLGYFVKGDGLEAGEVP